jgi:pimeloyl-ACP methyl ester carboxylesterase
MRPPRQPTRWSAWVARVALAVVVGVALALAIDIARSGGPAAWLARHSLAAPYARTGERVDIGGRSIYLDCRGVGSPTIVLEAGMGSGADGWGTVLDGLAAISRTCAYDRPGRGTSDPRGRHTLADTAMDLRFALQSAGEPAPFIVVGHSHGGDYVRVFATRFQPEVAGIVLLDTFDPDLEAVWVHPLLGDLRPEYEERLDGLRALVASVEDLDWATSERQLHDSRPMGTPIEVLRAARHEPRLDAATNQAIESALIAGYESLSPGMVRYELATGAGHMVQIDRPDLVIAATRRLVDAARSAGRQGGACRQQQAVGTGCIERCTDCLGLYALDCSYLTGAASTRSPARLSHSWGSIHCLSIDVRPTRPSPDPRADASSCRSSPQG